MSELELFASQKYKILHGTQLMEFVTLNDNSTLLDKIILVSCGLNLCDSVVPFECIISFPNIIITLL